jgi:hypothetical protein
MDRLEQGATTSWEAWDGSDSHIHDTFISIGSWFIQRASAESESMKDRPGSDIFSSGRESGAT